MRWIRNWFAERRLKREWDVEFRNALTCFLVQMSMEALDHHIFQHEIAKAELGTFDNHDAHEAAHQSYPYGRRIFW